MARYLLPGGEFGPVPAIKVTLAPSNALVTLGYTTWTVRRGSDSPVQIDFCPYCGVELLDPLTEGLRALHREPLCAWCQRRSAAWKAIPLGRRTALPICDRCDGQTEPA